MKLPTSHIEGIANLLVADDPRRAAERTLGFLVSLSEANGGAVLAVDRRDLGLYCCSPNLSLQRLESIRALWTSGRLAKGKNRPSGFTPQVIVPILDQGREIGFLLLDSPNHFDQEAAAVFVLALAKAIVASRCPRQPTRMEALLGAIAPSDIERLQLLDALSKNEWNIARVARLMGLTRPTIYQRMLRLGIERKRVPKTLRRGAVIA
jgi:hypothetical protein